MKKLLKLLLPSWYAIILVIGLLVVQALCELALPEYTSAIVNVGIQQNGVEGFAPEVIRKTEMESLLAYTDSETAEEVLGYYTEADMEAGEVYVLRELSGDEKARAAEFIEDALLMPMVMRYAMENMTAESDIAIDFSAFSEELEGLPEGYVPDMSDPMVIGLIAEKLEELDSSILEQMAVGYVIGEYETVGVDLGQKQSDYMMSVGWIMIAYAFLAMLAAILISFFAARVGGRFARDTRSAVFGSVMKFSSREMDSFSTASLITRSTNDIQQIQMTVIMFLRMMIYGPILGIGAFTKVMAQDTGMSWVIAVAVAAILVLVGFLFTVALPKFQVIQKLVDKLNLVTREILTGLPVIRAFSREEHERKRFDLANLDLTKTNIFVNRVMAIMMPTMMFIMNGVSVLIIWVGADSVDAGMMQVGDLMAFISYTMQIIMTFLMLSMMSIILPRAIISMKRVSEVLRKETAIHDPEKPVKFDEKVKGRIEFRDVSFHYENAEEDVLKNISFVSEPGKTTAIIGSTGSGKSTLANLIPRFFDVTGGEILVNGADIRSVTLHDLREKIGYVPQKAVLFSGTIRSNIAYSDEMMTEAEIKAAAEIAQAEEFITEKPEGYDSEIAQGGSNVSGGQKQRLSIARAVAKKPEIYLFDDSFSALDYKTDVALRRALAKNTGNSTVIIVAQRISTVLNADQIIVLDEGTIAGKGTHKELLETCEVYRDIAYSQLSEEELGRKEEA